MILIDPGVRPVVDRPLAVVPRLLGAVVVDMDQSSLIVDNGPQLLQEDLKRSELQCQTHPLFAKPPSAP